MSNTNNFDSPDDMDPILDKDMDFEDFDGGKEGSASSDWKKSPLFKFGVVALVVITIIAMISMFGGDKVEAPVSNVGKGAGETFKEAPGIKEVSPVMKEAIEEKNDQRIDEAQKQGISAIPTPIAPPKAILEVPTEDAQSEDPLLRWQQMQTERAKAQREQQLMQEQQVQADPERDSKVQGLANSMSQQMSQIYSNLGPKSLQHIKVYTPPPLNEGGVDGAGVSSNIDAAAVNQLNVAPQKPDTVIVPAGKIEYAQMMLEANSDIPGPVVALVASGQFNGAKLLGKFSAQEEYLVITFNTMVTKKGTSIPINAYAIDPNTSLTGVATDVDHRYLKRIILPAAAKFVEGLGDAYAETTTETTQNSTTTTTSSKDLNTKQELGKAVSEMAKGVGKVLSEDGKATKPLVVVAAGTPLGILFMESVTDTKILQARSGYSGQVQAQQVNQNNSQQQQIPNNFLNQLQLLQNGIQGQQFLLQNNSGGNSFNNNQQGVTTSTGAAKQ